MCVVWTDILDLRPTRQNHRNLFKFKRLKKYWFSITQSHFRRYHSWNFTNRIIYRTDATYRLHAGVWSLVTLGSTRMSHKGKYKLSYVPWGVHVGAIRKSRCRKRIEFDVETSSPGLTYYSRSLLEYVRSRQGSGNPVVWFGSEATLGITWSLLRYASQYKILIENLRSKYCPRSSNICWYYF